MQWRLVAATVGVLLGSTAAEAQQTKTIDVLIEQKLAKDSVRAAIILDAIRSYHTFDSSMKYAIADVDTIRNLPKARRQIVERVEALHATRRKDVLVLKDEYMLGDRTYLLANGQVELSKGFGMLRTVYDRTRTQELGSELVIGIPRDLPGVPLWTLTNFVHSAISHERFHHEIDDHPLIGDGITNAIINFDNPRHRRGYNLAERFLTQNPSEAKRLNQFRMNNDSVYAALHNSHQPQIQALNEANDAYARGDFTLTSQLLSQGHRQSTDFHLQREFCYSLLQFDKERSTKHAPVVCNVYSTGQTR